MKDLVKDKKALLTSFVIIRTKKCGCKA